MASEIWQGSNVNGSAGVDWNIGSNWNTGVVPQAGDSVEIPAGTPLADLFGATTTIASLTVDNGGSADLTGDMTITGNLVASGGVGIDSQIEVEDGGSTLTVDGTLTVTNAGAPFTIGNRFQTAMTTVVVNALSNTGAIDIAGNAGSAAQTPVLAQMDVASTAGMGGMAGVLTGSIALGIGIAGGGGPGDALLDFTGGGLINTIENGSVALNGPLAFIATGNATSSSSALTGALTIANGASLNLANGATLAPQSLTASGGVGIDSAIESPGGSTLFIGGMLTAANSGAPFALGNEDQTSPTTVTATAVTNTGGIEIGGNGGNAGQIPVLAQLDVASTAGFGGMAGVLTGNVTLGMGIGGAGGPGDALLDFMGGGLISTIENGTLALNGPLAFLASGAATSSNSALTGPLTIASSGGLLLQSGPSIVTGALTDIGSIDVDTGFLAVGGSGLTIVGLLTVTGILTLGRSAMVQAGPTVTATAGLDNSGTINLTGDAPDNLAAVLDIGGAAGLGTTGDLSGNVNLTGLSLLDFTGGGFITAIDTTGHLFIDGPNAFLASAAATASNSALTNLALIEGFFTLQDGAALTTGTGLSVGNGSNGAGLNVDGSGSGGSALRIGGMLTLSDFATASIGNSGITTSTLVTVTALDFTGTTSAPTLTLIGGAAQAMLSVGSAAGFGTAGTLSGGNVTLKGNALLDFTGGGQLASTAFGTSIALNGADAFIASGNAESSNSALLGLTTMAGNLTLLNGAAVTTSGGLTIGNGSNGANVALQNGAGLTVDGMLSLVGTLDSFSVTSAGVGAAALANAAGIGIGAGGALAVAGVLDNTGNLNIGAVGLATSATVSAGGLANTGSIELTGGAAQGLLDVGSAAPATWTGSVDLAGNALLEFAGGSIDTVAAGGQILLNGGAAFVADSGATGANGALSGLSTNAGGSLLLENGASVTTMPGLDFTNAAGASGGTNGDRIGVDDIGFGGTGGSTLAIGGTLNNTGNVFVGDVFLTAAATLDAAALVNTGSLNIFGNTANTAQGTVDIAGAAPTTWTGNANLNFDALLEFGGTAGITSIATGASIDLNGANARISLASAPSGNSALTTLTENLGSLALTSGAAIATTAGFDNFGNVTIGAGSTLNFGENVYDQAGGSTFDAGTLTADTVVIAGGAFELAAGGAMIGDQFTFAGIPGGTLKIDGAVMPTAAIDALSPGDTIDLTSVAFTSGSAPSLLANNVLQVTESSGTFDLNLDPAQNFAGDTFQLAGDGASGTAITMSGPGAYAAADPLMINTSGELVFDQVVNGQMAFGTIGGLGPEWEFDGAAPFGTDGEPYFLIRDTGSVEPGAVDIGQVVNGSAVYTPVLGLGLEWQFGGAADFLGNGQAEFLIRDTGVVAPGTLDLMNPNSATPFTAIGGLGLEWQFDGTGDLLGDGHNGFLIRNTGNVEPGALDVGEVVNGAAQFTPIGGVGTEWQFEGTGDFLGDGHTGFLIWNSGSADLGAMAIGEVVNGSLQFTDIGGVGPEWQFVGTGNYVDTNKTDFLLRNTGNGALVVGSVSGAAGNGAVGFTPVGGVGLEWAFHTNNPPSFA